MSDPALTPSPRPLHPRRAALLVMLGLFFAWVGLLTWLYFAEVVAS